MAKKYVKVTGLSKVFDVSTDGKTLDTTKLKTSISDVANEYSILYLTPSIDDSIYGYQIGQGYTWARGILIGNKTATLVDASNGLDGLATVKDVYNTIIENEEVTALVCGAINEKADDISTRIANLSSVLIDLSTRLGALESNKS